MIEIYCIVCKSLVPIDDVVIQFVPSAHAICLHCYLMIVEGWRPVPRWVRDEVEAVMRST